MKHYNQRCAVCDGLVKEDGCKYFQALSTKPQVVLRVAHVCSPECLGEFIEADGKVKFLQHTYVHTYTERYRDDD